MLLPLKHLTVLLLPLWPKILMSLALSMVMVIMITMVITMVMTMVLTITMAKATGVKPMIIPMVGMVMTMGMSMMVTVPMTMSCVFLHSWGSNCVRLCICFPFALLWNLSTLMCAVPTHAFAVGVFDRTLDMTLSNDGVWEGNVVGETPTPVIDEEVVFLSPQRLPDIRL